MRDHWGSSSVKSQWCGDWQLEGEVKWKLRPSSGSPPAHPVLGQRVSGGPREQTGDYAVRAQEPSGRLTKPSTSFGPGLEEQWISPLSVSLWPNSSGHLSGLQSVRCGLPIWAAWGDLGPVWLDAWLPQGWQLGRVWEPGHEGAANWNLPPLKGLGPWRVKVVSWDFALSYQDRKYHLSGRGLLEHCYLTITWPQEQRIWRQEQRSNHAHLSPFAFKGNCWNFSVIFQFLGYEPPISLYETVTNLSLFQPVMFLYSLTSLCSRHMDLRFGNNNTISVNKNALEMSRLSFLYQHNSMSF